jgi:hypothetical protein
MAYNPCGSPFCPAGEPNEGIPAYPRCPRNAPRDQAACNPRQCPNLNLKAWDRQTSRSSLLLVSELCLSQAIGRRAEYLRASAQGNASSCPKARSPYERFRRLRIPRRPNRKIERTLQTIVFLSSRIPHLLHQINSSTDHSRSVINNIRLSNLASTLARSSRSDAARVSTPRLSPAHSSSTDALASPAPSRRIFPTA